MCVEASWVGVYNLAILHVRLLAGADSTVRLSVQHHRNLQRPLHCKLRSCSVAQCAACYVPSNRRSEGRSRTSGVLVYSKITGHYV